MGLERHALWLHSTSEVEFVRINLSGSETDLPRILHLLSKIIPFYFLSFNINMLSANLDEY